MSDLECKKELQNAVRAIRRKRETLAVKGPWSKGVWEYINRLGDKSYCLSLAIGDLARKADRA